MRLTDLDGRLQPGGRAHGRNGRRGGGRGSAFLRELPEHTGEEGGEEGAPVLVFSVQEGSFVHELAPRS